MHSFTGPPLAPGVPVPTDKICFNSYSFYPIEYYAVNITDVINSSLVDFTSACIAHSTDLFPRECSPFHLLVTARNKVGSSNSSNRTIGIINDIQYDHHYGFLCCFADNDGNFGPCDCILYKSK